MLNNEEKIDNFDDYVRDQALGQLSCYNDAEKSLFFSSCNIIKIEIDAEICQKELSQINHPNFLDLQYNSFDFWFSSLFHEIIHCYQIAGSTLGGIDSLLASYQLFAFDEIVKEFKLSSESDIKNYFRKTKNKSYLGKVSYVYFWEKLVELRCLFGADCYFFHDRTKYYIPKVMDFQQSIYSALRLFKEIEGGQNLSEEEFNGGCNRVFKDLVKVSENYIDYLVPHTNEYFHKEDKNAFKENYCYSSIANGWLFPTRVIVEGYARLCEIYVINNLISNLINNSNITNKKYDARKRFLQKFLETKYKGIYAVANELLFSALKWIRVEHGLEEAYETCCTIYELALMTRLYPGLINTENEISWVEIPISSRLGIMLEFFVSNKLKISDFCDPKKNLIQGLDKICETLGWIKYSKCIETLYDYYNKPEIKNLYMGRLSRAIIKNKLEGKIFIYNIDILNLPVLKLFKDGGNIPDAYGINEDELKDIYNEVIEFLLKETFSREVIYKKNLETTFELLKIHVLQSCNRNQVETYLEKLGMKEFIKTSHLYH